MIAILNILACGGTSAVKWEKIKSKLPPMDDLKVFITRNREDLSDVVKSSLKRGETNFIAGGGDGSVNILLNVLIKSTDLNQIENIKIGAIGLGSSNDFHKPFKNIIEGIPYALNFNYSQPRDIGYTDFFNNGIKHRKYFLINASLGLTAYGNKIFNNGDWFLKTIKRINSDLAIYYAALKTIFNFRNIDIQIHTKTTGSFQTNLSNLGIVKNSHFSGNLMYDSPTNYCNGMFNFFLCEKMNKIEYIKLFNALAKNRFKNVIKSRSWTGSELKVTSEKPFLVEYDGEIVSTDKASFGILKNKIRVCT